MPEPAEGGDGRWLIDSRWGVVQPLVAAPGVETIGELELIEHLEAGGLLVDSRIPEHLHSGVIAGAVTIPHDEVTKDLDLFRGEQRVALYCNGPQCPASPDAITALLEAGIDPGRLLYYRGGILDWLACGYPLVPTEG